nr:efflux pump fub11 [Quercus suber]
MVKRLAKANGGIFEPEMRLTIAVPFGILLPVTLFWYGWSAYYGLHWASTIFSLVPFGFGIVGLFLPISTYIVDSYPVYAASATAANVIMRSVVGALLPLAGLPLYSALGLGWGNSLLGFIALSMVPLPFLFHKFGARLRKKDRQHWKDKGYDAPGSFMWMPAVAPSFASVDTKEQPIDIENQQRRNRSLTA